MLILKMCSIDESACDLCTPLHVYCIPDLGHYPCNDKNIQTSTAAYFVSIKRYNSIFNDPTRYVYVSLLIGCSHFQRCLSILLKIIRLTPFTIQSHIKWAVLKFEYAWNSKEMCILTHPEHPCGKLHLD